MATTSAARLAGAPAAAAPKATWLGRDELCRRWGISRATSYRWQAEGHLSAPVRLGPGVARWPVEEIEALERRAAGDR